MYSVDERVQWYEDNFGNPYLLTGRVVSMVNQNTVCVLRDDNQTEVILHTSQVSPYVEPEVEDYSIESNQGDWWDDEY
jgi:ribosomal protein S17